METRVPILHWLTCYLELSDSSGGKLQLTWKAALHQGRTSTRCWDECFATGTEIVLKYHYYTVGGNIYRQKDGAAMGVDLAVEG